MMSAAAVWTLCATGALAQTEIEFIQWWEPEMPDGALRGIMDEFEAANPDIKVTLVSGPYSATHDQIVVGAASGTLSDVVGLDGAWVNGLAKQGAIASLDPLMDAAGYDRSQIADIIEVDGQSHCSHSPRSSIRSSSTSTSPKPPALRKCRPIARSSPMPRRR